jgi:hypothetical protein
LDAVRAVVLSLGVERRVVIESDDFALAIGCLFFSGGLAGVLAPSKPAAAVLITLAFELLAIAAVWAARDAANVSDDVWRAAGRSKAVWRNVLLFFAPLGIGGLAAIAYFAAVRPQLEAGGAAY